VPPSRLDILRVDRERPLEVLQRELGVERLEVAERAPVEGLPVRGVEVDRDENLIERSTRTAISDRVSVLLETHTGERSVAEKRRIERVVRNCLGVKTSSIWVVVACRMRYFDHGPRTSVLRGAFKHRLSR